MRLAVFRAFLNEDWEVRTLLAFLHARALLGQQAPVTFIQYPAKEAARGEGTAWVCLAKAVWIAEQVLGPRTPAMAKRLEEIMRRGAVQVTPPILILAFSSTFMDPGPLRCSLGG